MGKTYTGKASTTSNLQIALARPVDDRIVVNEYADLKKADTWNVNGSPYQYQGMVVSVISDRTVYMYIGTSGSTQYQYDQYWVKLPTVADIKESLGTLYSYKGSREFAKLPTTGVSVGDVWNVQDEFTIVTDDTEKKYPAGTNVACSGFDNKNIPIWEPLGGTTDGLATEDYVDSAIDTALENFKPKTDDLLSDTDKAKLALVSNDSVGSGDIYKTDLLTKAEGSTVNSTWLTALSSIYNNGAGNGKLNFMTAGGSKVKVDAVRGSYLSVTIGFWKSGKYYEMTIENKEVKNTEIVFKTSLSGRISPLDGYNGSNSIFSATIGGSMVHLKPTQALSQKGDSCNFIEVDNNNANLPTGRTLQYRLGQYSLTEEAGGDIVVAELADSQSTERKYIIHWAQSDNANMPTGISMSQIQDDIQSFREAASANTALINEINNRTKWFDLDRD